MPCSLPHTTKTTELQQGVGATRTSKPAYPLCFCLLSSKKHLSSLESSLSNNPMHRIPASSRDRGWRRMPLSNYTHTSSFRHSSCIHNNPGCSSSSSSVNHASSLALISTSRGLDSSSLCTSIRRSRNSK